MMGWFGRGARIEHLLKQINGRIINMTKTVEEVLADLTTMKEHLIAKGAELSVSIGDLKTQIAALKETQNSGGGISGPDLDKLDAAVLEVDGIVATLGAPAAVVTPPVTDPVTSGT